MLRRRRLLLLGLGVTGLLLVAGIASHGRPLAASHGAGPTTAFFDYAYTTVGLGLLVVFAVALYALATTKPTRSHPVRKRWHLLSTFLTFAVLAGIGTYLIHHGYLARLRRFEQQHLHARAAHRGGGAKNHAAGGDARSARVRWDEVALFGALLVAAALYVVSTRRAGPAARPWRLRSSEAVSLALDESLDDLRNEPDLRRAIVAAYARMERALAQAGTPRLASEAPNEYLERALGELDTSAPAVRRLTDLFEWAKFSQHEPEPPMRDEAIDALVAVRDELRAPREAAVA